MGNKKSIKVKALINIKYDKKCFEIGDEFNVRENDSTEMKENGYIEIIGEVEEVNEEESSREGA